MDETNKVVECMLTTIDNPFNPFDDFDKWFAYDEANGYHSCSYLANIMKTSDSFSVEDQMKEKERAIDEIVRINLNGMYKKVTRD